MNAIVLQCGGPTPVVNASLAAVIAACQAESSVRQLWGSRFGLQGLVTGDLVELTGLPSALLAPLRTQPGAALGSSRHLLTEADLPIALTHLQERAVDTVFVIGGNGAMAAAHKLAQAAAIATYHVQGEPLRVVGIPKTVDNDLVGTDVAPGYASAARFIAQTTRDIALDLHSMRHFDDVAVLETMGRHVGWLAAASALARQEPDDAPDLILLPEVTLDEDALIEKIEAVHQRKGVCLLVASEGIRGADGRFLAEKLGQTETDTSGQKLLGLAAGVAPYLAHLIRQRLGLRCRQIRPDTIQRSSSALASEVDRTLAALVGTQAVWAAVQGASEVMVGLARAADGWQTVLTPLLAVIGQERKLLPPFIDAGGWDVSDSFLDYARPLVGELDIDAVHF